MVFIVFSIFYGHNAKKSTIKHLKQLGFKLGVPVKKIQLDNNKYLLNNFNPTTSLIDEYASSFKGKMKIAEAFFFDSAYFHFLCVKFNLFLL